MKRVKDGTSIQKIVAEWLAANDYDGLCNPDAECGCTLDDLMICGQPNESQCVCGYRVQVPDEYAEDYDYWMSTRDDNRIVKAIFFDSKLPNGDLETRDGFITAIQRSGRYIEEHAENLLGEYPSLLTEMDITAKFRFDSAPTVEVRREHIACNSAQYPQDSAAVDAMGAAK